MVAGRDRPVMGASHGGIIAHNSVKDCLERIERLKVKATENQGAMADTQRDLAAALEHEKNA